MIAGDDNADAVIFATGSEVAIAVDALPLLKEKGISAKVVSVPSMELFAKQSDAYRAEVIGTPKARVAIEAGIEHELGASCSARRAASSACTSFGASGPTEDALRVLRHHAQRRS